MSLNKIKNLLITFSAALIALIVLVLAFKSPLSSINSKLTDQLYTRDEIREDIVIIGIDDKSTLPSPLGLGRFTQWSRVNYANLLDQINKDNPKSVAFDIFFTKPTESIPISFIKGMNGDYESIKEDYLGPEIKDDAIFAKALEKTENAIIAFTVDENNEKLLPIPIFKQSADIGFIKANLDDEAILREIPIAFNDNDGTKYTSLAVKATGVEINQIPTDTDGNMMINYFGDPFSYKMYSFIDVMDGNIAKDTFTDKYVLIGAISNKEAKDYVATPRSKASKMPGVEIHANIIQTILDQKFITNQSTASLIAVIVLIALALTFAFASTGIMVSTIILLLSLVGYYLSAKLAYANGVILNIVYPILAIIVTYIAVWIYRFFVADRGKREMKSAFGHYVSKDLVEEIAKNPDLVKLGGEKRIITVFFTDIEGSTTYSEQVPINQWVAQINEYFTVMESIVQKNGGTLDKYEGDALMGFFGAPLDQPDQVSRAYSATIEMRRSLIKLHKKWQKEDKPLIKFRIGINTGEAIVGNFGSKNRFDYTAMGDTVNTASRLESAANKAYNTATMVAGFESKITQEDLNKFIIREIDDVLLPGKNQAVKLYQLIGHTNESTPQLQELLATYAEGLKAYREKNFALAITHFQKFETDGPSKVMLARCQILAQGSKVEGLEENMLFRVLHK